MGLFDEVVIECPIPNLPTGKVEPFGGARWQTKDFEMPYMDQYRITADGRLEAEIVHYEDRSDPNAPADSLAALRGCLTPVHDGWKDLSFHGVLDLCHLVDYRKPTQEFVRLRATFTHGQLEKIERAPDDA